MSKRHLEHQRQLERYLVSKRHLERVIQSGTVYGVVVPASPGAVVGVQASSKRNSCAVVGVQESSGDGSKEGTFCNGWTFVICRTVFNR